MSDETEIDKTPDAVVDEQIGETIHETEDGKEETQEWKKILKELETKREADWEAYRKEREELLNRLSAGEEDRRNLREQLEALSHPSQTTTESTTTENPPPETTVDPVVEAVVEKSESKNEDVRKRRRTLF